jgi:hypothetical protein
LESFAQRGGGSSGKALRTALMYYLADREAERSAWLVPSFAAGPHVDPSITVELDETTWRAVAEEAVRQGVTTETLAVHALIYFLADFDSGRVAELLGDGLEATD